jgi:hypothetical protein
MMYIILTTYNYLLFVSKRKVIEKLTVIKYHIIFNTIACIIALYSIFCVKIDYYIKPLGDLFRNFTIKIIYYT